MNVFNKRIHNYYRKAFDKYNKTFDVPKLHPDESGKVRKLYGRKEMFCYHQFYKSISGQFDVRFMADDFYYSKVDQYYNDWNLAHIVDNKCFYELLLPQIPQCTTFAYRINAEWFDSNRNVISINELQDKINNTNENLIAKIATDAEGGHGVLMIPKESNQENLLFDFAGKNNQDLIVQYCLKQSAKLARLHEESVNSIRVLSLRRGGKTKIYSTVLRMGIGESTVDNASSGGIVCGINDEGKLRKFAYSVYTGEKFDCHPTTKVKFEDFVVPGIERIRKYVSVTKYAF